jgi:DNA-binding HxlR family transcriptional regulator
MRDILFKGFGTFKEFSSSNEGMATNILADRLKKMTANGLITASRSNEDRRVMHYRPTPKGLDLAPVMLAMMLWTDKHEDHVVPAEKIARMAEDGDKFLAEALAQFGHTHPVGAKN